MSFGGARPFYPGEAPSAMAMCRKVARNGNDCGRCTTMRRTETITGIITSVAGQNFTYQTYDSTDGKGTCNLAVSLYTCGDGGLATYASLYGVTNIAIDQSGNIYLWTVGLANAGGNSIREITAVDEKINTIAPPTAFGLATDGSCSNLGYPGMTMASHRSRLAWDWDSRSPTTEPSICPSRKQARNPLAGSPQPTRRSCCKRTGPARPPMTHGDTWSTGNWVL
jgi:hypothetical protein